MWQLRLLRSTSFVTRVYHLSWCGSTIPVGFSGDDGLPRPRSFRLAVERLALKSTQKREPGCTGLFLRSPELRLPPSDPPELRRPGGPFDLARLDAAERHL